MNKNTFIQIKTRQHRETSDKIKNNNHHSHGPKSLRRTHLAKSNVLFHFTQVQRKRTTSPSNELAVSFHTNNIHIYIGYGQLIEAEVFRIKSHVCASRVRFAAKVRVNAGSTYVVATFSRSARSTKSSKRWSLCTVIRECDSLNKRILCLTQYSARHSLLHRSGRYKLWHCIACENIPELLKCDQSNIEIIQLERMAIVHIASFTFY